MRGENSSTTVIIIIIIIIIIIVETSIQQQFLKHAALQEYSSFFRKMFKKSVIAYVKFLIVNYNNQGSN